jgi:hypothetical protein
MNVYALSPADCNPLSIRCCCQTRTQEAQARPHNCRAGTVAQQGKRKYARNAASTVLLAVRVRIPPLLPPMPQQGQQGGG